MEPSAVWRQHGQKKMKKSLASDGRMGEGVNMSRMKCRRQTQRVWEGEFRRRRKGRVGKQHKRRGMRERERQKTHLGLSLNISDLRHHQIYLIAKYVLM